MINVENINRVEFLGDDIYLGLFPRTDKGEIYIDYIPFIFGRLYLKDGQEIDMTLDLYPPEERHTTEEYWVKENRMYINVSWTKLKEVIGEITKIDGFEYQLTH